mmetsp:Transcript_9581/g.28955  ORF Transcript_9581/g.28955 Transcript_9581/m.28955 type:complete len:229 (-) Transcript_9581:269-955(-)
MFEADPCDGPLRSALQEKVLRGGLWRSSNRRARYNVIYERQHPLPGLDRSRQLDRHCIHGWQHLLRLFSHGVPGAALHGLLALVQQSDALREPVFVGAGDAHVCAQEFSAWVAGAAQEQRKVPHRPFTAYEQRCCGAVLHHRRNQGIRGRLLRNGGDGAASQQRCSVLPGARHRAHPSAVVLLCHRLWRALRQEPVPFSHERNGSDARSARAGPAAESAPVTVPGRGR